MAIDFTPLEKDEIKAIDIVKQQNITFDDVREEIQRLYDLTASFIEGTTDAEISFVPYDPDADDPFAVTEEEKNIGWTLGHLVAHVTASNEESAVFTSLLARGIAQGGRIRTETPWQEMNTTAKAFQRLEESKRIILAYLDAIPDDPNLETLRVFGSERSANFFGPTNALASIVMGLSHHNGHIEQFKEVRRQAKEATTAAV